MNRCPALRASQRVAPAPLHVPSSVPKYRVPLDEAAFNAILAGNIMAISAKLSPEMLARFFELTDLEPVQPVIKICCRRYAVEDDQDRMTLDTNVHTDTGKTLPHAVLEFKSTRPDSPPEPLAALHLRPIKLSKFLWATEV